MVLEPGEQSPLFRVSFCEEESFFQLLQCFSSSQPANKIYAISIVVHDRRSFVNEISDIEKHKVGDSPESNVKPGTEQIPCSRLFSYSFSQQLCYKLLLLRSQPTNPIPMLPNTTAPGAGTIVRSCEPGLISQLVFTLGSLPRCSVSKP